MNPGKGPGREKLFSIFRDLVRADSAPGREAEVRDYVTGFCRAMGLRVHEDDAGTRTGGDSGNLFVTVPGALDLPPIVLNAHMDTIGPHAKVTLVETPGRFSSSGDTVLGADCKAGVAAMLSAVESFLEEGGPRRPLQLVFTVQEEMGLVGARNMDLRLLEGDWGVVLDGSGPVGGIVVEAPGRYELEFTVTGRSAHAGVEPELGKNAIACAAEAIAGLRQGRLDQETTSNIGLVSGGSAVNVVPGRAVVEGEVRGMSEARLDQEKERMVEVFRRAAGRHECELGVRAELSFEHFRLDPDSQPVRLLSEALERVGANVTLRSSGGGSDANVFNRAGLEMAVMCIGLANAHSTGEFIPKDELHRVARAVAEMVRLAGERGDPS